MGGGGWPCKLSCLLLVQKWIKKKLFTKNITIKKHIRTFYLKTFFIKKDCCTTQLHIVCIYVYEPAQNSKNYGRPHTISACYLPRSLVPPLPIFRINLTPIDTVRLLYNKILIFSFRHNTRTYPSEVFNVVKSCQIDSPSKFRKTLEPDFSWKIHPLLQRFFRSRRRERASVVVVRVNKTYFYCFRNGRRSGNVRFCRGAVRRVLKQNLPLRFFFFFLLRPHKFIINDRKKPWPPWPRSTGRLGNAVEHEDRPVRGTMFSSAGGRVGVRRARKTDPWTSSLARGEFRVGENVTRQRSSTAFSTIRDRGYCVLKRVRWPTPNLTRASAPIAAPSRKREYGSERDGGFKRFSTPPPPLPPPARAAFAIRPPFHGVCTTQTGERARKKSLKRRVENVFFFLVSKTSLKKTQTPFTVVPNSVTCGFPSNNYELNGPHGFEVPVR